MTVYFGTVSNRGSRTRPAGQTRSLQGATTNTVFARIFGNVNVPEGTEGKKISVLNLFPEGDDSILYVDPRELSTIDEMSFLKQHLQSVANWKAVASYLMIDHRPEMEAAAEKAVGEPVKEMSNLMAVAVSKYFLGNGNETDVKTAYQESQAGDDSTTKDTLARYLLPQVRRFEMTVAGFDIIGTARVKHFDYRFNDKILKLTYQLTNITMRGRKKSITKVSDRKEELTQFKFFKQRITNLKGLTNDYQTDLYHSELEDAYQETVQRFIDDIQGYLDRLMPEDAGLDHFLGFNIATAYDRLWDALGLTGEISKNGFSEESMRNFIAKKETAKEVALENKDVLVPKVQKALATRFEENSDPEAYAERALDAASDDLQLGADQRSKYMAKAMQATYNVLQQYADALRNIDSVTDLLIQYQATSKSHDAEIISHIKQILIGESENKRADKSVTAWQQAGTLYRQSFVQQVADEWMTMLKDNQIAINSQLNQNLDNKYIELHLSDAYQAFKKTHANRITQENLQDLIQEDQSKLRQDFKQFAQENYDEDAAIAVIKQSLLETLMATKPFSHTSGNYWMQQLNAHITSLPIALSYRGRGEEFGEKYQPSQAGFDGELLEYLNFLVTNDTLGLYDKLQSAIIEANGGELNQFARPVLSDLIERYVLNAIDGIKGVVQQRINAGQLQGRDQVEDVLRKITNASARSIAQQAQKITQSHINEVLDSITEQAMESYPQLGIDFEKAIADKHPGKRVLVDQINIDEIAESYLAKQTEEQEIDVQPAVKSAFVSYLQDVDITPQQFTASSGISIDDVASEGATKLQKRASQFTPGTDLGEEIQNDPDLQDDIFASYLELYASGHVGPDKSEIEAELIDTLDQNFITSSFFASVVGYSIDDAVDQIYSQASDGETINEQLVKQLFTPLIEKCQSVASNRVREALLERGISDDGRVAQYVTDNCRVVSEIMDLDEYIADHFADQQEY